MKILEALGSKQRLQIIEYLFEGISNLNEIAARLKLSKPTIMQHLKILQETGIIKKTILSTEGLHSTVKYEIRDNSKELVMSIRKACQNFVLSTES